MIQINVQTLARPVQSRVQKLKQNLLSLLFAVILSTEQTFNQFVKIFLTQTHIVLQQAPRQKEIEHEMLIRRIVLAMIVELANE